MKIFISWSGDRSRSVALALRDWLPLVLHYAQPWLSEKDIQAGERWATEVGRELEDSAFGILVITRENLSAPWILFEAGALSKAFSAAAVCPLLVGVDYSDLTGPLSQFQAKKVEKDSVVELLEAINLRSQSQIPIGRLHELLGALWSRFEKEIQELPPAEMQIEQKPRSQAQVLEDLVASVRRIEMRIEGVIEPRLLFNDVEVEVDGHFPDLERGIERISFTPRTDLIEDMAMVAGLDVASYGREWFLRDKLENKILKREDGVRYVGVARKRGLQLLLTTMPF